MIKAQIPYWDLLILLDSVLCVVSPLYILLFSSLLINDCFELL
jgi:hypothetical protein